MGIIDNFAFKIKNILTKGFLNSKNVEWVGKIQQIVDQYNSDENSALGGIAPNDADKQELPPEEKAPQGKPESPGRQETEGAGKRGEDDPLPASPQHEPEQAEVQQPDEQPLPW